MSDPSSWIVLKFGGTSVGDPGNWPGIRDAIRACRAEGARPFVVCSALSGVSNLLERMLADLDAGRSPDPHLRELRRRHREFGAALGLEAGSLIETHCRHVEGAVRPWTGTERPPAAGPTVPPSARALVMATGELLSSRIGAEWLRQQGESVAWKDARDLLRADAALEGASDHQRYLSATCAYARDDRIDRSLSSTPADSAVVTQGFIARDREGRTVLLGRGGSDTAASYFAAKLGARRLEIWTDVPGVFTANPQQVPQARLLRSLSYDEAETLAGMGAKVLHPRSIQPVREAGIPLHVRWTARPEVRGTVIAGRGSDLVEGVKAVSTRGRLCLVSMDRRAGWQPVGFMADVAACFKKHALSMDMLSSSSSTIQATLDPSVCNGLAEDLPRLLEDLRGVCDPRVDANVASVSLVGHGIRGTLHRLAPLLEPLRDRRLLMLTHSANDLTFSFVVQGGETDDLLRRLHVKLFEETPLTFPFGASWEELQGDGGPARSGAAAPSRREPLAAVGSPA